MCMQCDGFSREEALAHDAALIEKHGFMVMGVVHGGDPEKRDWAYTIGLGDRADHPELIVAGASFEFTGPWLNELGRRVLTGERFAAGDAVPTSQGTARFDTVHEIQFRLGTFDGWLALAAEGAVRSDHLVALQVFAPEHWFCPEHRGRQPALAHAHERVDVTYQSNRATRRLARGWG